MKRFKLALILVVVGLVLLTTSLQALADCTCFAVGKDASADGSTFVTIQQDTTSYDPRLWVIPAADHEPGSMRPCPDMPQYQRWYDEYGNPRNANEVYIAYDRQEPLEEGVVVKEFAIPQAEHTYGYLAGLFTVMNEHQVSFGMATLGCPDALWNDEGMLRATQLSYIAGERAKTAREAIQIMGELAEKYGFRGEYGPGKGFGVSDGDEVWIFHIMQAGAFWTPESGEPGAIWAAARVPDDEVAVFPNGAVIHEIDFNDPENYMWSENVQTVAEEMGWWDPDGGRPFSFQNVYLEGNHNPEGTRMRLWRGFSLLAPSLDLPDPDEQLYLEDEYGGPWRYPFSVKPDKPVTVLDLAKWTRDRLEGTKYDLTQGPLAGPFGAPTRTMGSSFTTADGQRVRESRSIDADSSQYSEICQSRNWLPDPIGGIVWWTAGRPSTAFRVPFYCGVTEIPESHSTGSHYEFEWGKTAYWAATFVNTFAHVMWNSIIEDVKVVQNEIEGEAIDLIPGIDARALELYKEDPERAREFLTNFSSLFARDATERYWDFAEYLILKYHHRYINLPKVSGKPEMNNKEYWVEEALKYQEEVRGRTQEHLEGQMIK